MNLYVNDFVLAPLWNFFWENEFPAFVCARPLYTNRQDRSDLEAIRLFKMVLTPSDFGAIAIIYGSL
jgi:hypothetical protein